MLQRGVTYKNAGSEFTLVEHNDYTNDSLFVRNSDGYYVIGNGVKELNGTNIEWERGKYLEQIGAEEAMKTFMEVTAFRVLESADLAEIAMDSSIVEDWTLSDIASIHEMRSIRDYLNEEYRNKETVELVHDKTCDAHTKSGRLPEMPFGQISYRICMALNDGEIDTETLENMNGFEVLEAVEEDSFEPFMKQNDTKLKSVNEHIKDVEERQNERTMDDKENPGRKREDLEIE